MAVRRRLGGDPPYDARFLARVDPSLLSHPAVVEADRCPLCGGLSPARAAAHRQRLVIEAITAAETETFDRLEHGPVWELPLPPFIGCGHVTHLPLPSWDTPDGRVYYARGPRNWG